MDQQADAEFSLYVAEVGGELRRRAFRLCGDWDRADDLVQETLIRVFLHWSSLDRRDELGAYIRTVMVRLFISDYRASNRSVEVITDEVPERESNSNDQDRLLDRLVLAEALALLGNRQRATVVLRYWEQLTAEEAADALGCSPSTVRSQAARALSTLRRLLRRKH